MSPGNGADKYPLCIKGCLYGLFTLQCQSPPVSRSGGGGGRWRFNLTGA